MFGWFLSAHIRFFFIISFATGVLSACPSPARALETLIYNQKISLSSSVLISKYLGERYDEYDIAQTDLNDDGLNEFIVKPSACGSENDYCLFSILAETDTKMLDLGTIVARDIAVDEKRFSGVRSIRAFDNPRNDFKFSLYVWEAPRARYKMLESGS